MEQLGRYRIEGELGQGGMGVVYRAIDTTLGRSVALKKLHPHLAKEPGLVARFQAEAQAAASLDHPNIVAVHDVGEQDGIQYFTMQYVEGDSLRAVLDRQPVLPVEQQLWIGGQLASALDYVHRKGVVHRDIKPENILLDLSGNVRITDFGIAKAADHTRLTAAGTMMGTPEYMSPEQVRGIDVDHRTDIYSLGVVLFEMGAGRVPFEGDAPIAVAMQHCEQPTPDPCLTQPTLPPWLSTVIQRCLAKGPEQRFATGGEVGAALTAQQPVAVPPHQRITPPPAPPPKASTIYAPISGTPTPSSPVTPTPPPIQGTPTPIQGTPTPVQGAPPPNQGTPQPFQGTPQPIQGTPQPIQGTPQPIQGTPQPIQGIPQPVPGIPQPIQTPYTPPVQATSPTPPAGTGRSSLLPIAIVVGVLLLLAVVGGGLVVVWLLRPVPVPASGEAIVMDRATTSSADTAVIASTEDTEATRRLAAEAVVRERYDAWILSWEARDLDRYMDFYSRDVEIKRAGKSPYDHAALRSRMGSHWSKLTYIRIDDGEPRLTHSGDRIELEVWHDYDSDTWWDKGTKRMTWLEEGGEWRIVGESFEKSSGGRK